MKTKILPLLFAMELAGVPVCRFLHRHVTANNGCGFGFDPNPAFKNSTLTIQP